MADADREIVRLTGLQTLSDKNDAATMADDLVRGAITHLKKPVGPIPQYSGTDTTEVGREVKKVQTQRDAANASVDKESENYRNATEAEKAAMDRKAAAEGDAIRADADRAKQVSNIFRDVAEMTGMTLDPNSEAAKISKQITEMRPELDSRLKEVRDLSDASNPLDWLANQFILPGKIDAYNAVATAYNSAQNTLDETIKTADNLAQFSTKAIPTITAGKAKAMADLASAEAGINKAKADENMAKQNVTFAQHKLANDISAALQTESMTKLQQEENKLKYTSQINAINLADTHAKRMLEAAKLSESLGETAALDVILRNYDLTMGHPKGTTTRFVYKTLKQDQRDNIIGIGAGSLGPDPFIGMANFYNSRPGPGVGGETMRLMNWLREKSEPIATNVKNQGIDTKNQPAQISKELRVMLNHEIAGASTMNNLFYELEPSKMIASGAVPADSPLAKILEPLTKQTGPVPTGMVMNTILASSTNDNEAGAAIAAYYSKNIELRNSSMNTSLIGVKLPHEYIYKDGGLLSLYRAKFDLTKPEEATKWVMFKRQMDAMNKGVMQGLAGGQEIQ